MPLNYFKIASDVCRKDAERRRRGEHIPMGYVPLARAAICVDCEALFLMGAACANCASTQVIPIALWLDRVRVDGPCPFLCCREGRSHRHLMCPVCRAARYGNTFCSTCREYCEKGRPR